jgi:hypothetical protein
MARVQEDPARTKTQRPASGGGQLPGRRELIVIFVWMPVGQQPTRAFIASGAFATAGFYYVTPPAARYVHKVKPYCFDGAGDTS